VYTEILSLWAFLWFVSTPLSCVLDILDEQAFDLRMNTVILSTRLVSLLLGCFLGSPRIALLVFASSGVLVYGYYCTAILGKCNVPARRPVTMLFRELLRFVPFGCAIAVVKMMNVGDAAVLLLATASVLFYLFTALRRQPELRNMLSGFMSKSPLRKVTLEVSA